MRLRDDSHDREAALAGVRRALRATDCCSLATVDAGGDGPPRPHVATVYFAHDESFRCYVASDPDTEHGRHLDRNPRVALAVAPDGQPQTAEKLGVQLLGTASRLDPTSEAGERAHDRYLDRFPTWAEFAPTPGDVAGLDSSFYEVAPERIKLFDEATFGRETWVELVAAAEGR